MGNYYSIQIKMSIFFILVYFHRFLSHNADAMQGAAKAGVGIGSGNNQAPTRAVTWPIGPYYIRPWRSAMA